MTQRKKILITGGSGLLGTYIKEILQIRSQYLVFAPKSNEVNFSDIAQTEECFSSFQPDIVIHLAAKVGGIKANIAEPTEFLLQNLAITNAVISAAHKYGVKKLLNIGSSCMYPRLCHQPMHEDDLLTGKLEPTNEGYALAKIVATKLLYYFYQQYNCNFYTLIFPNIYGKYEKMFSDNSHVIAGMLSKFLVAKKNTASNITLWGTGSARREFLHGSDAAAAIVWFMENCNAEDINNGCINIGSGTDISIFDLASVIKNIVQYTGDIVWDKCQPDGMPQKLMDTTQMSKFEWRPKWTLEEGIQEMYIHSQI
jgi:GDP-L-fucose synthase